MGNQLAAFDHAVNHPKPHLPSHAHAYSSQFPCSMVVSPPRDVVVARFARGCLLVRLDVDPLRACCRLSPRGALEKSALPPPPPPFSLDPLHQPEPSNPHVLLIHPLWLRCHLPYPRCRDGACGGGRSTFERLPRCDHTPPPSFTPHRIFPVVSPIRDSVLGAADVLWHHLA